MLRTKKQSQNEIEIAASTALRYSDSPKDESFKCKSENWSKRRKRIESISNR